jgi:nucleotide-binding universal stress UspA family protein
MIKEVLVYTFGDLSHDSVIRAAAAFAAHHNARLTGLFVKPDVMAYSVAYGNYPLGLAETFYQLQASYCEKIKARFESITADYELRCQWHQTDEYEKKPRPAFYSDLIFVRQPDKESSVIFNDTDFVDHLITDTGLPTVVIPSNWSAENFAQRPVLGWKETREAVSAVRHALPIMRDAKDLDIVTITQATDYNEELIDGIEISDYLSKHEVKTKYFAERMVEQDQNEADTLLRHVENRGRDLIIIGGYGHSRFREIVLGGMTRSLIKKSPAPVLLSH